MPEGNCQEQASSIAWHPCSLSVGCVKLLCILIIKICKKNKVIYSVQWENGKNIQKVSFEEMVASGYKDKGRASNEHQPRFKSRVMKWIFMRQMANLGVSQWEIRLNKVK